MRISRLYTQQELSQGTSISLGTKASHYLTHVLRAKPSQSIILFNGFSQHDYLAHVVKTGKIVALDIVEQIETFKESGLNISISQALSKNDHMDMMIQKCTELGVNAFNIFNSARTQIPLKANKLDKKLAHWNQVAQSACEQCGRSIIPSIQFFPDIYSAISETSTEFKIMLDFEGSPIAQQFQNNSVKSINILLGTEGGLAPDEINFAETKCFSKVRLGSRVLRTETAAITATALVQMLIGDLG